MRKDLTIHFLYMLALFGLVMVVRKWLTLPYWQFFVGGVLGTLLPDVDYLLQVYFLKPTEAVSREALGLIGQKNFVKTWDLLVTDRSNKKDLTIHSIYFQLVFLAFAFYIITSSGSLFGRGLVLAFTLHLFMDQITDFVETKSLDSWFNRIPIVLEPLQKKAYLVIMGIAIFLLGFYF